MFGLYSVKFSALQLIACLLMRPEMTIPRFNGAIGSTSDQEVPGSIPAGSCAFFASLSDQLEQKNQRKLSI